MQPDLVCRKPSTNNNNNKDKNNKNNKNNKNKNNKNKNKNNKNKNNKNKNKNKNNNNNNKSIASPRLPPMLQLLFSSYSAGCAISCRDVSASVFEASSCIFLLHKV
jgi:hypothetical protein